MCALRLGKMQATIGHLKARADIARREGANGRGREGRRRERYEKEFECERQLAVQRGAGRIQSALHVMLS